MKEKADVLQGTLALMVLKTLDVLGSLHKGVVNVFARLEPFPLVIPPERA